MVRILCNEMSSRPAIAFFLVLIFGFVHSQQIDWDKAEYIQPCRRSDVNINKCIRNSFNHLRPYLKDGIKELNVPSLDPLVITKLAMENGHGAVRMRALFNNLTIYGPSNYTVQRATSDIKRLQMAFFVTLPRIESLGHYDVNGNVLLFPVRSQGEFWAQFSNITAEARIQGKEIKGEDGLTYMRIEKLVINFDLAKARFKIKDQSNSGIIANAMHRFLNEHSQEIIKEMKPAASLTISRYFKDFLNAVFLKVPVSAWLKD